MISDIIILIFDFLLTGGFVFPSACLSNSPVWMIVCMCNIGTFLLRMPSHCWCFCWIKGLNTPEVHCSRSKLMYDWQFSIVECEVIFSVLRKFDLNFSVLPFCILRDYAIFTDLSSVISDVQNCCATYNQYGDCNFLLNGP